MEEGKKYGWYSQDAVNDGKPIYMYLDPNHKIVYVSSSLLVFYGSYGSFARGACCSCLTELTGLVPINWYTCCKRSVPRLQSA